jgi:hypothetical protein
MKTKKTRHQQGSIRKVPRARGFAWEVRFSAGQEGGEQKSKSSFFNSSEYPTEASVRKVLETAVVLAKPQSQGGQSRDVSKIIVLFNFQCGRRDFQCFIIHFGEDYTWVRTIIGLQHSNKPISCLLPEEHFLLWHLRTPYPNTDFEFFGGTRMRAIP